MSKIFLDILDEGRKAVFEKLSTFSQYGYLAGGTALALQIGHRKSVRDIAANKAYTVGRRALWRDYVDIFWLLKYGYLTLSDIIGSAKRKYGIEFVETQFLEQLGYFTDVSVVPIQYVKDAHESEEIKKHLLSQVQTYVHAQFDKKQPAHIA